MRPESDSCCPVSGGSSLGFNCNLLQTVSQTRSCEVEESADLQRQLALPRVDEMDRHRCGLEFGQHSRCTVDSIQLPLETRMTSGSMCVSLWLIRELG